MCLPAVMVMVCSVVLTFTLLSGGGNDRDGSDGGDNDLVNTYLELVF